MWDDRVLSHRAIEYDLSRYRRVLRRTTIGGNTTIMGPFFQKHVLPLHQAECLRKDRCSCTIRSHEQNTTPVKNITYALLHGRCRAWDADQT